MKPNVWPAAPNIGGVQITETDSRYAHLIGVRARQESQPENFESVRGSHRLDVFVDCADQDLPPESVDHSLWLALFTQPIEHGDVVEICARALLANRQQSARQCNLFRRVEKRQLC